MSDDHRPRLGSTTPLPKIISVDDHVVEPPHLWQTWLPARWREQGPRSERRGIGEMEHIGGGTYRQSFDPDGPAADCWVYEDLVYINKRHVAAVGFDRDDMTMSPITYDEMRPGCYEPGARIADMEANWVEASLCFPSFPRFCGQTFLEAKDRQLALACVLAYNDWMVEEWCGDSRGALLPLCLIPLWDAELAAAEVRRNAARGVRAVCFSEIPPHLGLPSIHSGSWDPFFAACAETGTVVCMHIGSSSKMPATSADAPVAVAATLSFGNAMSSLCDFLFSGVLIRFPDLVLAYSEGQIGWLPYILERADDVWREHRAWGGVKDVVLEPPSTYFRRQVYGCFFRDQHGLDSLAAIGSDRITFETDYPHTDSTWPDTRVVAEQMVQHLSDEDVYKIMRGNAIEMLGLQLDLDRGMKLGDVVNPEAALWGKPLDGIRILALEQMQALPWATQLLSRLGADVVKIEAPGTGDLGRTALPAMPDPQGRPVGATFLRNNLNKRSVVIDLKDPRGHELVLRLAPRFDVVAENFRAGAAERLGLAYDDIAAVHPAVVYLAISGFGRAVPTGTADSPYDGWPALASMVEAMSGAYEFKRPAGQAPVGSPMGGLGDIVTALFAVVGIQAGLRQRDRTGQGQQIDVAMLDAMVAVLDVVPNFWSLGSPMGTPWAGILHGFRADDGWFMLQVLRAHQWPDLARAIDRPEWADDARFATPQGWLDHLESDIRPAIEQWAAGRTKREASAALNAAGLVAGPSATDAEVVADPHLAQRHMLVEHPRPDGGAQPVLIPGLPLKFGQVAEGPDRRVPWLGEHTDEVLAGELGLGTDELAALRADRVIA